MRTSSLAVSAIVLLGGLTLVPAPSTALDPNVVVSPEAGPVELFAFGFRLYKRGEKLEASQALRYAADKGHAGARWKLGRMYAEGDGVPEDDYEAFKIFETIVREQEDDTTTTSPDAAYVAGAVVALADYLRHGIPESPVEADLQQARQLYFHAATFLGSSKAQFELGRMLLNGEGGKANPRQAARWLKLAAAKGNVGAQALFGSLIFEGERISLRADRVEGLTLLTMALKNAGPDDEEWIRTLQEKAFSAASETERQMALAHVDGESETMRN